MSLLVLIFKRFVDPVEQAWDKRHSDMVVVRFEFENGEVREVRGSAANEWWHDLHRQACGRRVNWTRHKFNTFFKSKTDGVRSKLDQLIKERYENQGL